MRHGTFPQSQTSQQILWRQTSNSPRSRYFLDHQRDQWLLTALGPVQWPAGVETTKREKVVILFDEGKFLKKPLRSFVTEPTVVDAVIYAI